MAQRLARAADGIDWDVDEANAAWSGLVAELRTCHPGFVDQHCTSSSTTAARLRGAGFRIVVNGIADTWVLHVLLADALVPPGIPGVPAEPDRVAALRDNDCGRHQLTGTWNLY